jgi:hypothetical protein
MSDMSFQIVPLAPEPFVALSRLTEVELAHPHAHRMIADVPESYPCRVSLLYAEPGDELLLLNFEHQGADSPYRARGPIFVRAGQPSARPAPGQVPPLVRRALLSVRGYGPEGWIEFAEVIEGRDLEATIARAFKSPGVEYLHLHFARPGCYLCRVDRAPSQ